MAALSREGRNGLRNVHREIELAEKKVAAWLIIGEHGKTKQASGKIIVRYTKKASIVSVLFYATGNAQQVMRQQMVRQQIMRQLLTTHRLLIASQLSEQQKL
ncbi:MAG: hypothetical protein IJG30_01890 [Synergistaceae bacterium]|nr:hypothetical protein [Synergistaceae bacterium]